MSGPVLLLSIFAFASPGGSPSHHPNPAWLPGTHDVGVARVTTSTYETDAGVDDIIWPVGENVGQGSNTPRALIFNIGTVTAAIPACFQIFDSMSTLVYEDMDTILLTPGDEGVMSFAIWRALPGTYRGHVTTLLPGDQNPANDTVSNQFTVIPDSHDIGMFPLIPDTLPPGEVVPRISLSNYGGEEEDFPVVCGIFRDDTLQVYQSDTVWVMLPHGSDLTVDLGPPWEATPRYYLARFTIFAGIPDFGDTADVHVTVTSGSVAEPPNHQQAPRAFTLEAPYPSPSRDRVDIRYDLPRDCRVRLEILDGSGRRVRALVAGLLGAGQHRTEWDGHDDSGRRLGRGVYICRMEAEELRTTAKVVIAGR